MRSDIRLYDPYRRIAVSSIIASWFPIVVFMTHVLLVYVIHAYARFPSIDIPMHFVGGVAITYFFARTFRPVERHVFRESNQGYPIYLFFIFGLTGLAAAVWELLEFLASVWSSRSWQAGLPDTMLDITLGLAGGLLYLIGCLVATWIRHEEGGTQAI